MSRAASGGPADDAGGVLWRRYFASACIFLGVQPPEAAWFLTPQEYWELYDMKAEVASPPKTDYCTAEEGAEMIAELKKMGKI